MVHELVVEFRHDSNRAIYTDRHTVFSMKARIICRDDILAATAQNVEKSERLKHPEESTTRCAVLLGVAVT